MSRLDSGHNSLAGLSLDDVLGSENDRPLPPPPPPPQPLPRLTRTLLDVIREQSKDGHQDKYSWKTFRDKLRIKRPGSSWDSNDHSPTLDIHIVHNTYNSHHQNHWFNSKSTGSIDDDIHIQDLIQTVPMSDPPAVTGRPLFSRGTSMRIADTGHHDESTNDGPPSKSFKPQMSRHDSVRTPSHNGDGDGESDEMLRPRGVTFAEERTLSARQAVVAQEAAEAETAAAIAAEAASAAAAAAREQEEKEAEEKAEKEALAAGPQPTMSLMDLLEESDRQMGLTGSRYVMGVDDDEEYEDEDDEEDRVVEVEGGGGENSCCICMVKVKGATYVPCGHVFCRLCSREMMVQKGYCPVCTGFALEFLEIF